VPQSTAAVSASAIRRAAKLMAAALKSTMPPPLIQKLISNPALLRALVDELSLFVGGEAMKVTAGRRQIVFLGNTGPNNGREWVVIQYRNRPNGNGENVMRISQRLGREPTLDQPVQWTDPSLMGTFLRNMRPKLSRPGVMLMNKLVKASTEGASTVKAVAGGQGFEGDLKYGDLETRMKQALTGWEVTLKTKKVARPNIVGGGGTYEWFALDGKQGEQFVFFYGLALNRHILTLGAETPRGAMTLRTTNDALNAMQTGWKSTAKVDVQAGDRYVAKKRGQYWYVWDTKTNTAGGDPLVDKKTAEKYARLQNADDRARASTRVQAGTWQEQAKAELEAELGGIETEEGRDSGRDYFTLETMSGRADNGESEWMVFKDAKAAERYCIEYVNDMLEDDASMFDQKWLKQHVTVSPTDIRIISQEDADAYVDNIRYESDERVLDEAGMLRAWESLEDKKDALSDKMLEEMDPRKQSQMQKQIEKMEQAQSKLVDKADQKLRASMAKDTADALKKDPLAWAEELGFDIETNRPPWLQIDTRKAGYDGEEVDLKSGAVAFGTN
jgi:hypothetical protein